MSNSTGKKRVTLADVGKASGYHGTTVGLALKDHPRIPLKTREKIKQVARELGYHPDPVLSSLIAYRRRKIDYRFNSKIAIVRDKQGSNDFSTDTGYYGESILKGINERAAELGFDIEYFAVGLDRKREKQVDRILKARGISAVIIFGLHRAGVPINFNWENYSVISLGYSHPNPRISRVTTKNRWATSTCVEKLLEHGYRRPILVIPKEYDERVDHGWSAGFLSACLERGISTKNLVYLPEDSSLVTSKHFLDFLTRSKADVIITSGPHLLPYLQDNGYAVPRDLGFICLDVLEDDTYLSGICQNAMEVGRQAVTLLSNLQINNVRGLTSHEYIHLVVGSWKPGMTLGRKSS